MDQYHTLRTSTATHTIPTFETPNKTSSINSNDKNLPKSVPTAKIVLLGDASVGKTALRSQFVHHSFSSAYRATIGGDFLTYSVNTIKGPCNLQIWDTAGQERFNSISRSFYRGCDGCILVYDVTNAASFSNLSLWLNEFMTNCFVDNPIIMVVGNKLDKENAYRTISTRQARDFVKENIEIRDPSSLITLIPMPQKKTSQILISQAQEQSPDYLTGQSAMSGETTDFLTPRSAYTIQGQESEPESDLELDTSLSNTHDDYLSSSLTTIKAKSAFSAVTTTPARITALAYNADFTRSNIPQEMKLNIIDQMEIVLDQLCLETSAKTNQNVDMLFEKMALFTLRKHETTVTNFNFDTGVNQDRIDLDGGRLDGKKGQGCC